MIIERMEFRLKFGKAREAREIWKQIGEELKKEQMFEGELRLLTDLTGPSYTMILESHLKGFNDFRPGQYYWSRNQRIQELYKQFIPLCDSANRELYRIEAEI